MLPAGTYAAVVAPVDTDRGPVHVQWGPATANSPFVGAVSFEVLNGPQAGQKISAFLYFGEKSAVRSMESLRACGFTGDDIDKFSDQAPDIECQIVVEHETYEGKTRAKVKWINKAGGGAFSFEKPLAPNELRRFSAQFKGALKQIPAVAGKKAERQQPSAAPIGGSGWSGGDDLPPPTNNPPDAADDDGIPF